MAQGIAIEKMVPGELIYLNLPLHPGSKADRRPPTPPANPVKRMAENMGYPGVELSWSPGTDDNWVSYYEVFRDGKSIDKVAKGTFYFDHSAGADLAAKYAIRTVDGAGNVSEPVSTGAGSSRAQVFDDAAGAPLNLNGQWQRQEGLQPAHAGTLSTANLPGAAVELAFTGRRVQWFSKMGADCGQAAVTVDDAPPVTVDTYSADDIWGVCVFSKEFPAAGPHRLRIVVTGQRAPNAKDARINLDAIRVE